MNNVQLAHTVKPTTVNMVALLEGLTKVETEINELEKAIVSEMLKPSDKTSYACSLCGRYPIPREVSLMLAQVKSLKKEAKELNKVKTAYETIFRYSVTSGNIPNDEFLILGYYPSCDIPEESEDEDEGEGFHIDTIVFDEDEDDFRTVGA